MARNRSTSPDSQRSTGIMGIAFSLFSIGVVFTGLALYQHEFILNFFFPVPDIKSLYPFGDELWTTGPPAAANDQVIPWKLKVSDSELADLKDRLLNTKFGIPISGQNFEYGFPGDELKKVVDYWLNKYDWKKEEELINKYDHFKTNIEGLNIHFVRIRPEKSDKKNLRIVPIILLHGWPGSFFELYKLIPLLSTPRQIEGDNFAAFEVIIPSLPGFGFSDPAQKIGLQHRHMARIFNKLMTRLNFEKYFVHGGDFGSAIGRAMAVMYPESVSGLELTMYPIPGAVALVKNVLALMTPSWLVEPVDSRALLSTNFITLMRESGYMHIQATKPDTVGVALLNSPAGLAAYILEKFSSWTNLGNINKPDGALAEYFSMDDLLTNVMIYWVSNSIMTSQRLYKEVFAESRFDKDAWSPILVPAVLSDFPHDIPTTHPPKEHLKPYYKDLVAVVKHESGGHFPAMERPKELANDIWTLAKAVLSRKSS